jgi:hypothetical protein
MTEEERKRLNKYYDSLLLKQPRKPKSKCQIVIAPAMTQLERDMQGITNNRLDKSFKTNNRMAKANVRGR